MLAESYQQMEAMKSLSMQTGDPGEKGIPESTVAAMCLIPFYGLIVPLRIFSDSRKEAVT
jgi:hypothetical protein